MNSTSIIQNIYRCGFLKNFMVLKEALRFLINLIINGNYATDANLVSKVCALCVEAYTIPNDEETLDVTLFALSLVSQNFENHSLILEQSSILNIISQRIRAVQRIGNASYLMDFIMNLSYNSDFHESLMAYKIIQLAYQIFSSLDEHGHTSLVTIISHLIE